MQEPNAAVPTSELVGQDARLVEQELVRFLAAQEPSQSACPLPALVQAAREESLLSLASRLTLSPGKRVRPLLALWMSRAFGAQPQAQPQPLECDENILRIAACVEILHAASLAVDDVQDGSLERRGEPSLHSVFGMPLALNVGGWCYFAAVSWLSDGHLRDLALSTLVRCHEGQGLDLSHGRSAVVDALFKASHAERLDFYDATARCKTGALMEFVSEACGHVLGLPRETTLAATRSLEIYGRAFQILDDVKNFVPALSGSKTHEDLSQGLRNRVCLHLVGALDGKGLEEARQRCHLGTFREFVLASPKLQDALARTLAEGEALREEAAGILRVLTAHRPGAFDYLALLLDKPLGELRAALLASVPALAGGRTSTRGTTGASKSSNGAAFAARRGALGTA
jgi:geranylgeranyl pyrophosphate synthase